MSLPSKASSCCSFSGSASSVFRGDDEALLDNLLEACAAHKSNERHAGFGRELVSFFADGESLDADAVVAAQKAKSRPPSGSKRETIKERRAAPSHAPMSINTSNSGRNAFKGYANSKGSSSSSPSLSLRSVSPSSSMGSSPPSSSACPAYFTSPRPDALPMPSMGFLSRAGACNAPSQEGGAPVMFLNGFALPVRA